MTGAVNKGGGHTPGPWSLGRQYGQSKTEIVGCANQDGGDIAIAACWTHREASKGEFHLDPEGCANARLIAAAPDLLEAAEDAAKELASVLGAVADGDIPLRNLRAAIAKARGQ